MKKSILNLAVTLKFINPVHYNGKIVIMFSVVLMRDDMCQLSMEINSSEKEHLILISRMVDVQYCQRINQFYCVLIGMKQNCVASRMTHSDHSSE